MAESVEDYEIDADEFARWRDALIKASQKTVVMTRPQGWDNYLCLCRWRVPSGGVVKSVTASSGEIPLG